MTFDRMSLKEDTVEECELLRNRWRQGIIHPTSSFTTYIDSDDEMEDRLPEEEGTSDDD